MKLKNILQLNAKRFLTTRYSSGFTNIALLISLAIILLPAAQLTLTNPSPTKTSSQPGTVAKIAADGDRLYGLPDGFTCKSSDKLYNGYGYYSCDRKNNRAENLADVVYDYNIDDSNPQLWNEISNHIKSVSFCTDICWVNKVAEIKVKATVIPNGIEYKGVGIEITGLGVWGCLSNAMTNDTCTIIFTGMGMVGETYKATSMVYGKDNKPLIDKDVLIGAPIPLPADGITYSGTIELKADPPGPDGATAVPTTKPSADGATAVPRLSPSPTPVLERCDTSCAGASAPGGKGEGSTCSPPDGGTWQKDSAHSPWCAANPGFEGDTCWKCEPLKSKLMRDSLVCKDHKGLSNDIDEPITPRCDGKPFDMEDAKAGKYCGKEYTDVYLCADGETDARSYEGLSGENNTKNPCNGDVWCPGKVPTAGPGTPIPTVNPGGYCPASKNTCEDKECDSYSPKKSRSDSNLNIANIADQACKGINPFTGAKYGNFCCAKPAATPTTGSNNFTLKADTTAVSAGSTVNITWEHISGSASRTNCEATTSPSNADWNSTNPTSSALAAKGSGHGVRNITSKVTLYMTCDYASGSPSRLSKDVTVNIIGATTTTPTPTTRAGGGNVSACGRTGNAGQNMHCYGGDNDCACGYSCSGSGGTAYCKATSYGTPGSLCGSDALGSGEYACAKATQNSSGGYDSPEAYCNRLSPQGSYTRITGGSNGVTYEGPDDACRGVGARYCCKKTQAGGNQISAPSAAPTSVSGSGSADCSNRDRLGVGCACNAMGNCGVLSTLACVIISKPGPGAGCCPDIGYRWCPNSSGEPGDEKCQTYPYTNCR